jgi:hypothetical protein
LHVRRTWLFALSDLKRTRGVHAVFTGLKVKRDFVHAQAIPAAEKIVDRHPVHRLRR